MSAAEFGRWIDFFNKNGRCGPVRMFDAGPALLAWKIDQIAGGRTQVKDYLPYYSEPEQVASVDDVFRALGGLKRG